MFRVTLFLSVTYNYYAEYKYTIVLINAHYNVLVD